MATFLAIVRVVHVETWEVEAETKAETKEEAKEKFSQLTEDVIDDDSGGEVVDWEVQSVRQA